jgi:hypothetical protein
MVELSMEYKLDRMFEREKKSITKTQLIQLRIQLTEADLRGLRV